MIKKTFGILFKLFLICFFSIVVFYTGLSFFGLWTIARLAHEENTRSEAEKKYIAANIPPKPVEIRIEGCPSGSWNTKLYGYVEILDTKIEVPCRLSNGKYYLVGRQFSLHWPESLRNDANKKLSFSVLFEGTPNVFSLTDLDTEQTPVPMKGFSLVKVTLPKNGAMYFDCGDTGCRGWAVVSRNFKALINVHSDKNIVPEDLKLVVDRVFLRVK